MKCLGVVISILKPPSFEIWFNLLKMQEYQKELLLFNILELEYGWHPAFINSPEELEFIQRKLSGVSNNEDFYIGGTIHFNSTGILSNFSEYLSDSSGEH